MFLDELTPLLKEFTQHPVAFVGGFFSGTLRLSLTEDPLKSWLERHTGTTMTTPTSTGTNFNGRTDTPQSIEIE